jgi:UDP-3-O-[3-hydroxymyristoyl] N-acetylglucosamine deacetylase/3-hydroxyacyl-[acyl-carrier-protein] dehydratase
MLLLREVHQVLMFFIVLLSAYFWGLQKLQLTSTYARLQRTIKREVAIWGRGLHTGQDCMITFKPAPEDYGYRFVRVDLPDSPEIPADIDHVIDIRRGTTIGVGDAKVHTTEHVLAALYGLQIDNCRIELTGPEPPVVDGSSKPFVDALLSVGFEQQSAPKNYLVIEETVEYVDEARGVHIVGCRLMIFAPRL